MIFVWYKVTNEQAAILQNSVPKTSAFVDAMPIYNQSTVTLIKTIFWITIDKLDDVTLVLVVFLF